MTGNYVDTSSYFSISTYEEMVLASDPVSEYYIKWKLPDAISGLYASSTFTIDGSTYYYKDYPSEFRGFNGVITEEAFVAYNPSISGWISNPIIERFETNAKIIEQSAFKYCNQLYSISLSNCSSIGSHAFYSAGCSNTYMPNCEYIGAYAFYKTGILRNNGLLSLSKCRYIGYGAFASCSNISYISLPKCTYIGPYAFANCGLLGFYNGNPSNVQFIGAYAFAENSFVSVDFSQCREIGQNAFAKCSSLTEVSLPECVSVGGSAFLSCTSLPSITLPKCKTLGQNAFKYCSSLLTVSLPECEYIGEGAFYNCKSLGKLYLDTSTVCELGGISVFNSISYYYSVYVRSSLVSAYRAALNWSSLGTHIKSIPS